MSAEHYDFVELGYGIKLLNPERTRSVFLQGDDAESFCNSVRTLDCVWEANGWESPNPACFPEYEDHLDVLIDPYF